LNNQLFSAELNFPGRSIPRKLNPAVFISNSIPSFWLSFANFQIQFGLQPLNDSSTSFTLAFGSPNLPTCCLNWRPE